MLLIMFLVITVKLASLLSFVCSKATYSRRLIVLRYSIPVALCLLDPICLPHVSGF